MMYVARSMFNSKRYRMDFEHRYRFSDKVSVSHSLSLEPQVRNVGYAGFDVKDPGTGMVIHYDDFGRRDISTVSNTLDLKYSFNTKMNISTRVRHYWSQVRYDELFDLLDNGKLQANNHDPSLPNQNYNIFTVDAVYTWEFAPGSFVNVVWKNSSEDFHRSVGDKYLKNLNKTLETGAVNNLSFKIIYFLDYLQLKKKKKT